jgi:hypothetical protein
METFYNTAIALKHIYLDEKYIVNESTRPCASGDKISV